LKPQHREAPVKRKYADGRVVWYARYTDKRGRRRSAGTFALKRDAQAAIDAAYAIAADTTTFGSYFARWIELHPRADRTNATNRHRIERVLTVPVDGRPLEEWRMRDLRRRHTLQLVDHMLRVQGRATTGGIQILRALSAMAEDAITDELAESNPFRGVKIRANDPRAGRSRRPVRVFTFAEMHAFAACAGAYEALVRTPADTGMRLGEFLALRRSDLVDGAFRVTRTTHEGTILEGTKTDHGEPSAGRLVPCPPGLQELIRATPTRIDTDVLFPTPTGKMWRERNFYRDVWEPTRTASGMDIRPHEMRHSYISHLRAVGVDDADLAAMAGHRVETMLSTYTHALGQSFERVRDVIG
jgi:integrase